MRFTPRTLLLPAVTVLLYAVSYPLGSLALTAFSPFLLILLRFLLTAVLLWPIVLLRRTTLPRGSQLWWTMLAGVAVQGVQFLGLYWAMAHGIGAGVAALIVAMNPVATALLNRVLLHQRESRWGLLALALGVIGVLAACLPRVLADSAIGPGLIAALLGLGGLAGGSLLQGSKLRTVDPIAYTAIGVTASIPLAGALALAQAEQVWASPIRAAQLLGVLVLTSAGGIAAYAACVRRMGPRPASTLFAIIPAVAVLAAWAIQAATPDPTIAIAILFGALACLAQARAGRTPAVARCPDRGTAVSCPLAPGESSR